MKVDFNLHLFADHEWPTEYDISEDGRRELDSYKEIEHFRDVIAYLVAEGKFWGRKPSERNTLDKIKKARRGLAQFISAVESGGPWLTFSMWFEEEEKESYYWECNDRAFLLESFIERAKLYENLLANEESDGEVSRGRSKNYFARMHAELLAATFQDHDVPLSSYQDGTYFQVLRIVLNEIFPGMKPEAYRRYGASALEQTRTK